MKIVSNKKPIYFFLWISILFASIGQISSDIYIPSLPYISETLSISIGQIQLTVALFMLGYSVARLFFGPISDAIGRKKPLLLGFIICFLGTAICFFATNIDILILGRFLQGFGAAAGNALGRVILCDVVEGKELAKYNSYFSMANITLIAMAPLFGGYIQHYFGWRANFFILALYVLIALVIAVFMLHETNTYKDRNHITPKGIATNLLKLCTNINFVVQAVIVFLAYGCILTWLTSGPFILQNQYHLTAVEFGWVAALIGFCYFLGAFINGKFVKVIGIIRMIRIGINFLLVSGILMLFFSIFNLHYSWLFISMIMLTLFGLSMVFPNAYAASVLPFKEISGIAISILSFVQMLGGFFFGAFIALLSNKTQIPVSFIFIICALISLFLMKFLKTKKRI